MLRLTYMLTVPAPAAVYPINFNDPRAPLFTPKIIGSHITLLYYSGFSYMMLGRCAGPPSFKSLLL